MVRLLNEIPALGQGGELTCAFSIEPAFGISPGHAELWFDAQNADGYKDGEHPLAG